MLNIKTFALVKKGVVAVLLISCVNCTSQNRNEYEVKKIHGKFLIEINVPNAYYSRFDQIEQSRLIIKDNREKNLIANYLDGIFLLNSVNSLNRYKSPVTDSTSIKAFSRIIQNAVNDYSAGKNEKLLRFNKNMFYLNIEATFTCATLGETIQMIPKLENYECCYSNRTVKIETYVILKVENLKVLGH